MNIGIDETRYRKGHRYITVVVNHDTKAKREQTIHAIESRNARRLQILRFAEELREQESIKEYDKNLWNSLVEYITVSGRGNIRFTFRDGTKIQG